MTDMDINDLMQYGYMELRMIIEWARKVPGRPRGLTTLEADFIQVRLLS